MGTITTSAAANVDVTGNQLTVSSGTVTITAAANVEPDATPLTLSITDPGIITWNDIDPGATQVWVPIEPYENYISSYSNSKLELIATGEKAGLWGSITNNNLQILEQLATDIYL